MSGEICDFLGVFLAIFLSGVVIKLVDDFLDADLDKLEGKTTLSIIWQKAVLPYSIILFSVAVLMDNHLPVSLFLASYIVGMTKEIKQRWVMGLTSWQESIFIAGLGFIFLPAKIFLFSLLVMFLVQLIDDLLDFYSDRFSIRSNLVFKLGTVESILLILITGIISLVLAPLETLIILISFPLIVHLLERRGVGFYG